VKLYATSDIHVSYAANRELIEATPEHPDDWLIVAGDVGEREEHVEYMIDALAPRFAKLIWVPGNHELWTRPLKTGLRGVKKYERLVQICRERGVHTPEDPYLLWPGEGGPHLLAPLFLLYDYSFRPDDVTADGAIPWAMEEGVLCVDERVLLPDPYASREAWCAARCEHTEARLEEAVAEHDCPLVLINHFPLRRDHAVLPLIPRFKIWCGTRRTEDWHRRFRASDVISGHLHIPKRRDLDGVRFHEVSLGYPEQWEWRRANRGIEPALRQILPALPAWPPASG
jgi:3',5'-cyclic AMP phosphodiesterase CpdA